MKRTFEMPDTEEEFYIMLYRDILIRGNHDDFDLQEVFFKLKRLVKEYYNK